MKRELELRNTFFLLFEDVCLQRKKNHGGREERERLKKQERKTLISGARS